MINYNLKGTDVTITDELRSYVESRLAHTDKFVGDDPTAHVDVELAHSALRDGGKYRAEFTLLSQGEVYRSEEWGTTLHEAIDIAMGELSTELRRSKKMKLKIFRHSAVRVKEFLRGWRKKV